MNLTPIFRTKILLTVPNCFTFWAHFLHIVLVLLKIKSHGVDFGDKHTPRKLSPRKYGHTHTHPPQTPAVGSAYRSANESDPAQRLPDPGAAESRRAGYFTAGTLFCGGSAHFRAPTGANLRCSRRPCPRDGCSRRGCGR